MSDELIRIYTGDWYFNAGIVGFLRTICNNNFEKLSEFDNQDLYIGDNFLDFNPNILKYFKENFYKQLFLNYFNKTQYLAYINKALTHKNKDNSLNISKSKKEVDKFPFQGLWKTLDQSLESKNDFLEFYAKIESITKEQIYELIKNKDKASLEKLLGYLTNGIIGLSKIGQYINDSVDKKYKIKSKKNRFCISCQERKGKFDVSNAISNIIGFNSDNSNWIWGFDANKVKFCSVCSLIYISASVGLVFSKKGKNYNNCFYFVNHNGNINLLLKSYIQFRYQLEDIKSSFSIYPVMVKESVKFTKSTKAEETLHNISFVEVKESGMGGQSTKGYNVYSFSMPEKLANFIDKNNQLIPKGYYKIDKSFFDIEENILKSTIEQTLGYKDIDKYIRIYISNTDGGRKFSPYKIIKYILRYINFIHGGNSMDMEKISKKGFANGKEIGNLFRSSERENQINSLVYQFLNDLKVANREKFLDKYLRVTISNGLESRFGNVEMNNKNAFLQFGYSFINGLLNTYQNEKGENNE